MIQPHVIKFAPSADHIYQDGEMIGAPAFFGLSDMSKANRAADKLISAVGAMNTFDAPGVVLYFFSSVLDPKAFSDTRLFAPDYSAMEGYLGQVFLWDNQQTIGTGEVAVSEDYNLCQPLPAIGGIVHVYAVYASVNATDDNEAQPAPMTIALCIEYEVKR